MDLGLLCGLGLWLSLLGSQGVCEEGLLYVLRRGSGLTWVLEPCGVHFYLGIGRKRQEDLALSRMHDLRPDDMLGLLVTMGGVRSDCLASEDGLIRLEVVGFLPCPTLVSPNAVNVLLLYKPLCFVSEGLPSTAGFQGPRAMKSGQ